jgi:hypothetical protein
MADEYEIPGMYISKSDVQMVFEYRMQLGEKEAKRRVDNLTDGQMRDIASAFASEFFNVNRCHRFHPKRL